MTIPAFAGLVRSAHDAPQGPATEQGVRPTVVTPLVLSTTLSQRNQASGWISDEDRIRATDEELRQRRAYDEMRVRATDIELSRQRAYDQMRVEQTERELRWQHGQQYQPDCNSGSGSYRPRPNPQDNNWGRPELQCYPKIPLPMPMPRDRHDRNDRGHGEYRSGGSGNNIAAAIILGTAIIIAANTEKQEAKKYQTPEYNAQQNGTYFSCREEAYANFRAKYNTSFVNSFSCEPSSRPIWIPSSLILDGTLVYIVYSKQYRSYGAWDNNGGWLSYQFSWTDTATVDALMASYNYVYPR